MTMGMLGRKLGMTQLFDEEGRAVSVTIVEAGPCPVVAHKSPEKDGYSAVQLGFEEKRPHKVTKPEKGTFDKAGVAPVHHLREFRVEDLETYPVGSAVTVELFEAGETVNVTGTSKGKGFAGVVKRHNFNRGPQSHGASLFHRRPGSSGASSYPGHVFKGKKMPGQMGNEKVTVKNLKIFAVDPEHNLLIVKGSIPGATKSLVFIRKAKV